MYTYIYIYICISIYNKYNIAVERLLNILNQTQNNIYHKANYSYESNNAVAAAAVATSPRPAQLAARLIKQSAFIFYLLLVVGGGGWWVVLAGGGGWWWLEAPGDHGRPKRPVPAHICILTKNDKNAKC